MAVVEHVELRTKNCTLYPCNFVGCVCSLFNDKTQFTMVESKKVYTVKK